MLIIPCLFSLVAIGDAQISSLLGGIYIEKSQLAAIRSEMAMLSQAANEAEVYSWHTDTC